LHRRLLIRLEEERLVEAVVARITITGEPPTDAWAIIGGIGHPVSVAVDEKPTAGLKLDLVGACVVVEFSVVRSACTG
jgi:hypothetical protein